MLVLFDDFIILLSVGVQIEETNRLPLSLAGVVDKLMATVKQISR